MMAQLTLTCIVTIQLISAAILAECLDDVSSLNDGDIAGDNTKHHFADAAVQTNVDPDTELANWNTQTAGSDCESYNYEQPPDASYSDTLHDAKPIERNPTTPPSTIETNYVEPSEQSEGQQNSEAPPASAADQSDQTGEPSGDGEQPKKKEECEETLCLNGGTCLVMEDGSEKCFCPEAFWGARCQLRNICKSIIADNLTGDQICNRIGRSCIIDDKLFRCQCGQNEFFLFKADHFKQQEQHAHHQQAQRSPLRRHSISSSGEHPPRTSGESRMNVLAYDAMLELVGQHAAQSDSLTQAKSTPASTRTKNTFYLAECRLVDKCLGVRCRQMSEVCEEGECKCNQNLGYIKDPQDNLCKLLNPCEMSAPDGGQRSICGEARCLPTYNKELYRCVCPIGYYAVQRGSERSSIQCAILSNFICLVPLLNKCQHICEIDGQQSSYRCSCWPGYRPGSRPGIDDHLCFFNEHLGAVSSQRLHSQIGSNDELDPEDPYASQRLPRLRRVVSFRLVSETEFTSDQASRSESKLTNLIRRMVILEPFDVGFRESQPGDTGHAGGDAKQKSPRPPDDEPAHIEGHHSPTAGIGNSNYNDDETLEDLTGAMSAQERCNMYCDENKICVLDDEATGSYRCICDRQGYVSVGDKCLDWCEAAEFSHGVRFLLSLTCVTGVCKRQPGKQRPPVNFASSFYNSLEFRMLSQEEQRLVKLEARSSWRPSLQCDCSSSPLVYEDSTSRLCKLNFSAILEPCLPGNEGHTDCVINKHAYCAVLHKDPMLHKRGMTIDQLMEQIVPASADNNTSAVKIEAAPQQPTSSTVNSSSSGKKAKLKDKPYVCVCSPEKKFLVDKPRNKARCVDECDLLNNECGRFNRMCRAATINSNEHFGYNAALVREDQDGGVRMNQFKRTGCECLPGFNVGPSEPRDFTLDTNYPEDGVGGGGASLSPNADQKSATDDSEPSQRPRRIGWDALEDLLQDATIMVNNSPKADQNLIQGDILGIGQDIERLRTRYMNINSRCLLDYDVIDFHARFKAPAGFQSAWVPLRRPASNSSIPAQTVVENVKQAQQQQKQQAKLTHSFSLAAADKIRQSRGSGGSPSTDTTLDGSTRLKEPDLSGSVTPSPASKVSEQQHQLQLDAREEMRFESEVFDQVDSKLLKVPQFMRADMSELYKHVVLVADCDFLASQKSFVAYEQCVRYRYWVVQKFRAHFSDWRQVMSNSLRETFDLMDGNIRFRVNKCETIIRRVTSVPSAYAESLQVTKESYPTAGESNGKPATSDDDQNHQASGAESEVEISQFDPWDQYARVDADLDCTLTIHSASDYDASGARRNARRVLLEKQLPRFIFDDKDVLTRTEDLSSTSERPDGSGAGVTTNNKKLEYYLLAPNSLIHHESYDQLAAHRKAFSPCNSEYSYCDKQTRCEMQDTVNYSCTCEAGYTPIGSRDIYFRDSRKEVCEDINECLFDVCKGNGLEDKSVCVNEIGDYKCQCIRHHVGDNKRFCDHICNVIACKHGDCRIPDEHHAFCECYEGYREADCSVQDPSVALRKANMIICSSIFASVLLLAITLAISLNSQLKKTKKELKRLEAAQEAVEFYEFSVQQPPYRHRVSKASIGS